MGLDLRPGEGAAAGLLFVAYFLFITFQYAVKSVRQATFIDTLGAERLPWVYLLVAVCSFPFLVVYTRLVDKVERHQLITGTCVAISLSMVVFWWLFASPAQWVPLVFYIWVSIVFVMTVSQFWSFADNTLDPRQAKRLFGFMGAGGLLGGAAGGQVAHVVTEVIGTRYALLVAAAILWLALGALSLVHRISPGGGERVAGAAGLRALDKARGGFEAVRGSRQLQTIATLVVLSVIVAQTVDLQFNWAVETSTSGLDERTAFFGNFYSVMGLAAFVFQIAFTSRILRKLGIGFGMRFLPVAMALGTGSMMAASIFFPLALLPSVFALKAGENGIRYSLDRSTREQLYLPVPAKARLKAKAFIDVLVQRSAKGVAALLLLPVTFGLVPPLYTGWLTLVLVAVWIAITATAQRQYVHAFRSGLRERTLDTRVPIKLADVETLEILVHSLGSADRRQVLQSLEILAANGRASLVPPLLLRHDDPEVRRKTLGVLRLAGCKDAAPLIERLLADPDPGVRAEAVQVLAWLDERNVCDLMLPRLRESDPGLRAAAISSLASQGDEHQVAEAATALRDLLSDQDPAVRLEAARALGAVDDPRFSAELVDLLYDSEPPVVREAIVAVRQRVDRTGFNPIYVPTLVSLLHDRQVKHEARETLVALGEPAAPTLAYFLADPDEPIWVRRALPMTLARIGSPAAVEGLLEAGLMTGDAFLRRKVLAAVATLPAHRRGGIEPDAVRGQIRIEASRYLQALADLCSLGLDRHGRLDGVLVRWDESSGTPDLLDRLLAERMADHLQNMFRLLLLSQPGKGVIEAHHSLVSRRPALRNAALEYLDNLLSGDEHRDVFAVIGDNVLEKKLAQAEKSYGTVVGSIDGALTRLLDGEGRGEDDHRDLSLAILYKIYTNRITELYPRVAHEHDTTPDPVIEETAQWIRQRLAPA